MKNELQSKNEKLQITLRLHAEGHRLHPLVPGGKRPLMKNWPNVRPSENDIRKWFSGDNNIGLITGNLIVIDSDKRQAAEYIWKHVVKTPWIVKTPRGYHFYTKCPAGLKIGNRVGVLEGVDLRGPGGYVVAEGSEVDGHVYRRIKSLSGKLPLFNPKWFPENKRSADVFHEDDVLRRITRARAYVARIEPAVSGQRGHDATYRVACLLVQRFGLTIEQAWPIILSWNEVCQPPWSHKALVHKLEDAVKQAVTY